MGTGDLLPLDAVFGLLLYQSNSLQHISDIVDTSFLPHSQCICGLNEWTKAIKNVRDYWHVLGHRIREHSICTKKLHSLQPKNMRFHHPANDIVI